MMTTSEKYRLYEASVQNAEDEVDILTDNFKKLRGRTPISLREDFCGTGALMCAWVQKSKKHTSVGVDLDPEPVDYGMAKHLKKLKLEEQERVTYMLGDVLKVKTEKTDICVALNFSYFVFKHRKQLLAYFTEVYRNLKSDGVFFLDLFGGPESQTVVEETRKYRGFDYFWDCSFYDAITNECNFHIHFKPKGQKKHKNVFNYDWRMWQLPELREILEDAGFKKTVVYWEGDNKRGGGNGVFSPTESEDNCLSWVAYIAALK